MRPKTLARLAALLSTVAAASAPAAVRAQNTVTLTPVPAPLANAATFNHVSSVSFDVANNTSGSLLTGIDLYFPQKWNGNIAGAQPPAGWVVTEVSRPYGQRALVRFRLQACPSTAYAIPSGGKGTFRIDLDPPQPSNADEAFTLDAYAWYDGCSATATGTNSNPTTSFKQVSLWMTASASATSGGSPLSTRVTFSIKNEATAATTVSLNGLTVAASGGTAGTPSCSPASVALAAGATAAIACDQVLTANPGGVASFTIASNASNLLGTFTAIGASVGPILVGGATARIAFDTIAAVPGDTVRATLTVANQTSGTIDVTPPTYAGLTGVAGLTKVASASDPAPVAGVAAGSTVAFAYLFTVNGPVGARYTATATASTSAGATNAATTPAGTATSWRVAWTPRAIVYGRTAPSFTITVANLSNDGIKEIDVVNPQNGTWTGIAAGTPSAGLGCQAATVSGAKSTIKCTGSVTQNQTATIPVTFTAMPQMTSGAASYPFQVVVWPASGVSYYATYAVTVTEMGATAVPEVAGVSLLTQPTGQTLYWVNTSNPSTGVVHDGVVILKAAAPGVPPRPSDGIDYTLPANQVAGQFVYADKNASSVTTASDAASGAWNYRICNHDANLIYSQCSSGFWNLQGYIDSVALPSGVAWAHTLGSAIYGYPGEWQGRVGVACNVPSLAVFAATSGARSFAPAALSTQPNVGTPAAPVSGGAAALAFGADTNGGVVAIDLANGSVPPGWSAAKGATESFVGGIAGVLQQYVGAAFQSSYSTDVLLLGSSTTGALYALDARNGATLWTKARPTPTATIGTQPHYDYGTNRLYVAYDNGGGVVAFDAIGSAAAPGAPLWTKAGSYVTPCTSGTASGQIACIERNGTLHVLDAATGADLLGGTGYASGVADANTLWPVGDGYVVSNASTLRRLVVSGGAVTGSSTSTVGATLSPPLVFVSNGFVYVSASDNRLHKLYLSNLADTGASVALAPSGSSPTLAPPAFDVADNLFLLGSSDGRLWAVPYF